MSPNERYRRELASPGFFADPVQAEAIARLDALYSSLLARDISAARGWRRWFRSTTTDGDIPLKGLYLWGGVGRGKTFVVDTFFACLPHGIGRRVHFHAFMRSVHGELKAARGLRNPLEHVASRWARGLRVLCLDEFHVVDITDAMLLAQLLRALFEHGVVLVTTSNEAPDHLYRGGLQRDRFLPAIDLLKKHLDVFEFRGDTDYRLRTLTQAATYYAPSSPGAEAAIAQRFDALTHGATVTAAPLQIEGRAIAVHAQADGVVWFDFAEICGGPRATADFIEIALCFHTVLISGVPRFTDDDNDAARRFVNLVDEFYDRSVNLLLTAAETPTDLYRGTRLEAPFRRTTSRLIEMQSAEYLARPHLGTYTD